MNTAKYVDEQIARLKSSGIPLSDAAWEAALLCVGWPYVYGNRGEYCTPEKRQAVYNKHGGETLISKCQVLKSGADSCAGCKWYPQGSRVRSFDCRGWTYWLLLQIYGWKLMGTGATKQWDNEDNWKAKGTVADGIPQGVIVCLFYHEKGNPTVMAHTGIYYNGETCECSNGVQHSRTLDKKWTHWGVPKCADEPVTVPEQTNHDPVNVQAPAGKPTIRRGSKGEFVTLAQTMLLNRGYKLPKYGADGDFGKETEAAVKLFQQDWNLAADGIVGAKTWSMLESTPTRTPYYRVSIGGLELGEAQKIIEEYPDAIMTQER